MMARRPRLTARRCHLPLMKLLLKHKGSALRQILNHLTVRCREEICEYIFNIIYGKLPGDKYTKNKLRTLLANRLADFHFVTNIDKPIDVRHKRLMQMTGGSLEELIATSVPLVEVLIESQKKKKQA